MKIKLLSKEDEETWDKFVLNHKDATFYHQIGYKEVVEETFSHKPYYLVAWENSEKRGSKPQSNSRSPESMVPRLWRGISGRGIVGCLSPLERGRAGIFEALPSDSQGQTTQIIGVLPLFRIKSTLFKNSLISLPFCNYGGVLTFNQKVEENLFKKAKEILKKENLDYLELRYLQKPSKISKTTRLDKVTMFIDLEKNEEKMWLKLRDKTRNQIRRAKRALLLPKWGESLLSDFYQPFSYNMRELGSPVLPFSFFLNLKKRFPNSVDFLVIYHKEKPIAGACLTFFKDIIEVPYSGAMWNIYRDLYPNMLLFWECLKMGISKKLKIFDFGRSTKYSSNYEFKRRWRAYPLQLYYQQYSKEKGIVDLSPKNPKYRIFIKIWQKLPISIANFLGPKIIRGLP